ncbi:hypothetical protein VTK26DRAFT_716 [Humicola hyalothermophila]
MATVARSQPGVSSDNLRGNPCSVLGELPLGIIQNVKSNAIESLTRELDNFHIHSTDKDKENLYEQHPVASQGHQPQPQLAPLRDAENDNALALASRDLPSNQEQLSKHQEGQFEWLLSVPAKGPAKGPAQHGSSRDDAKPGSSEKKLVFGCNLVRRRPQSGGTSEANGNQRNTYTLLATRIEGEGDFTIYQSEDAEESHQTEAHTTMAQPVAERPENSPGSQPAGDLSQVSTPASQIAREVDALDRLEADFEAIAEVTQKLEQIVSPSKANPSTPTTNGTEAKATPLKRAASVKAGVSTASGKTVQRSGSVRTPVSTATAAKADDKAAPGTATRRAVPRPASLLPPKPPAKSSKPPTVPAFELPGEAVARRLKEQREARRSQVMTPEQAAAVAAAYSPSVPHFKSSKPPTRPTFELPGEAISRKKRERREAELRAQEEEERKRREFKARPIRASLTPSTVPRDTLTSLARLNRQRGGSGESAASSTAVNNSNNSAAANKANKRNSMVGLSSTQSQNPPSRGRDQNATSTPASRATSTSTSAGSVRNGGAASSTAASSVASVSAGAGTRPMTEKERREQATKLARQEAAERSRMLSREWKEKQRRKEERERMEKMEKMKGEGSESTGGGVEEVAA